MNTCATATEQDQTRRLIRLTCRMLDRVRREPPVFGDKWRCLDEDCYVLLDDATRALCAATCGGGGAGGSRWSAALPRMLFDHPEHCDEILDLVAAEASPALRLASA